MEHHNLHAKLTGPQSRAPGGCYTCTHFHERVGHHVVCHDRGVHVQAMPETGCVFWMREIDADWSPDGIV